ncbi:MAG: hypothetical protein ACOCVF_00235 [bacterium]
MNKFIWGLDLSTTNVGLALWDIEGNLIELKHLELKVDKKINPDERYIYKANIFKEYVLNFQERLKEDYDGTLENIIIEEPLGGSNNLKTVTMLAEFNGICRYIMYEIFDIKPVKITVNESRKLFLPEYVTQKKVKGKLKDVLSMPKDVDKKHLIWEKVKNLYPSIEWVYDKKGNPKKMCYDMSDSIVVSIGGLKLLGYID